MLSVPWQTVVRSWPQTMLRVGDGDGRPRWRRCRAWNCGRRFGSVLRNDDFFFPFMSKSHMSCSSSMVTAACSHKGFCRGRAVALHPLNKMVMQLGEGTLAPGNRDVEWMTRICKQRGEWWIFFFVLLFGSILPQKTLFFPTDTPVCVYWCK